MDTPELPNLRDQLAMAALRLSVLFGSSRTLEEPHVAADVKLAYRYADEMLKARESHE